MNYSGKQEIYFKKQRTEMLKYCPKGAKRILEVGCGQGDFAKQLKDQYNAETWGIEYMESHAKEAQQVLDKVFIGECEKFLDELPNNYFDAIFFNDVLEHLLDPYMVLKKMKPKLTDNGRIISSLPNIGYHSALKMLIYNKDWKYENSGVMDLTHVRFFTKKSIERMYKKLGYKIITHEGINKTKSIMPYIYNLFVLFTALDIFYVQYATVVEKT